ncbi:MAG: hypothetical protein ABSC73_06970 [Acidimicrobiales bacterium]
MGSAGCRSRALEENSPYLVVGKLRADEQHDLVSRIERRIRSR